MLILLFPSVLFWLSLVRDGLRWLPLADFQPFDGWGAEPSPGWLLLLAGGKRGGG